MATLFAPSASASTSTTSLSNTAPATPPYTPAHNRKQKRPLSRANSPASSIHPTETISPAKKVARRGIITENDDLKVEELVEGDIGYQTDLDVVNPEEIEEVSSASDLDYDATGTDESADEAGGLSRGMSRLQCKDSEGEKETERLRKERLEKRRQGSRLFKRRHSQSVVTDPRSESEVTDLDALPDQDLAGSQRRLRRRVRGPEKRAPRSSPAFEGTGSDASRYRMGSRSLEVSADESEDMDVDRDQESAGATKGRRKTCCSG